MRRPCCDKEHMNKGAWTVQEDEKLMDYIQTHGEGCWRTLPRAAGLHRCGKSCRLRWINYLRPDVKRGNFGQDEEDLIIKLHALLGNRWSLIAGRLPGRTDNEVKNYWNSHIKRKLISNGIDPNNHRLHQTLPQQPLNYSTTSSLSMNDASKPMNTCADNDGVSDAASFLEDEKSGSINLNLNLTIASSSCSPLVDEMLPQIDQKTESTNEIETNRIPTLLLFR